MLMKKEVAYSRIKVIINNCDINDVYTSYCYSMFVQNINYSNCGISKFAAICIKMFKKLSIYILKRRGIKSLKIDIFYN